MQPHRLRELDGIRGIACAMVLVDHVIMPGVHFENIPGFSHISAWLIGGVDLFFVLSGFLIGGILLDNKDTLNYFQVFWVRRAGRILPVYYLLMATFFSMLLIRPLVWAPWLDDYLFKNMMPLWTYPLFVQNFAQAIDGGEGGARWVASTWSLAIEEQFYLVVPALVYVMTRRATAAFMTACIMAALIVRMHLWQMTGSWSAGYFLLPGRMDSLASGVLGAIAIRHAGTLHALQRFRRQLDLLAIVACLVLTTNILGFLDRLLPDSLSFGARSADFTLRSLVFGYLIVRVFLTPASSRYRRVLAMRPLVFLGSVSYALYTYHPAINGLLHGFAFGAEPAISDFAHLLVGFAVIALSICLAWLSTTYYEMPIRRWSQHVSYRRQPLAAPLEA